MANLKLPFRSIHDFIQGLLLFAQFCDGKSLKRNIIPLSLPSVRFAVSLPLLFDEQLKFFFLVEGQNDQRKKEIAAS